MSSCAGWYVPTASALSAMAHTLARKLLRQDEPGRSGTPSAGERKPRYAQNEPIRSLRLPRVFDATGLGMGRCGRCQPPPAARRRCPCRSCENASAGDSPATLFATRYHILGRLLALAKQDRSQKIGLRRLVLWTRALTKTDRFQSSYTAATVADSSGPVSRNRRLRLSALRSRLPVQTSVAIG